MTAVAIKDQPSVDERLVYRGPVQRLLTRPDIGTLVGAVGLFVFFWAVSDVFGIAAGAANYLDVSAGLGIMAVVVSLLMIGGEFDLSSGAMTGATAMLVVLLAKPQGEFGGAGLSLHIAVPLSLLFALGVGYFNATVVERTGLPSFIVTLGSFFTLIGAKLGFAKLFTDKVIVEGLDVAPGYDFWNALFGATWIRNEHVFADRDLTFAILLIAGSVLTLIGLFELSFTPRRPSRPVGLGVGVVGAAAALFGLRQLVETDTVAANWTYGVLVGAGVLVGMAGWGAWRYQPAVLSGQESPKLGRVALGLVAVAAGGLAAVQLDATSTKVLGFLLTVQGLRAILFVGLVAVGLGLLFGAARRGGSSLFRFVVALIISAVLVGIAFLIRAESQAVRFRSTAFAVLLLIALVNAGAAWLRFRHLPRSSGDAVADRVGRLLSIGGLLSVFAAVAVRLLFMTQAEVDATKAVITFRVSILFFLGSAVVASWVLANTKFGSWTFAVGGNKLAARSVGVPAARTKRILFMTVSGAAWLVGMLIAFRLNSVQANVGDGNEFLYIIAAVVGGNLLTGGYGSAAGGAIGALLMAMSFQGIPFSRWNSDWRFLFLGVILLLAVLANRYVRNKAEEAR